MRTTIQPGLYRDAWIWRVGFASKSRSASIFGGCDTLGGQFALLDD